MNPNALSFLNRQHSIPPADQYVIENIQSLEDGERISIQFFLPPNAQ